MASETTFDHWKVVFSWGKVRKRALTENPLMGGFWSFRFFIFTLSCVKIKKNSPWYTFFVSLHVPDNSGKQVNKLPLSRQKAKLARIESPEDNPLRPGLNLQHKIMFVFLFLHFLSIASGVVDVSLGFRGRVVRDIAWLEINIIECLDHQLMGGGTYTLHNWHFTTSYNNSCPSIVHFSFPKSDVILRHPVRHFHPQYLDAFWFYNCTSIKSYYYYQCCDSEDTRTRAKTQKGSRMPSFCHLHHLSLMFANHFVPVASCT